MDNGKELLCRSLLEFDFNLLPVEILNNPILILKADLVLYPINTEFAVNDNAKTSALYIRQVLDKWEDSSAMWNNQPSASFENQKSATIKTKNKNIPASIDVTEIVFNSIFKEKNNGFMIVYDDTHKKSFAAGQLFASPKNENPAIRPQLVIYIEYQKDRVFANKVSSITPTKPVENLLNDLYRKRNGGGSYPSYEQDRFSTNSVYQMNLRKVTVPSDPAPTKKINQ
ncbi:MAG: DNRLRE domain-containing protein [Chitinophagaceae bacterium]|nr:DNRLRE domain-containing protein [Chitinophagaceae bacterium]